MRLPPPPILLVILVGLGVLADLALRTPGLIPWPLNLFGLPFVTGGLLLVKVCIDLFRNVGKGTPDPNRPPQVLITQGPYRYVRNPIYIGLAFIHLGLALLLGSLFVLALIPVFLVSVHFGFVLREERWLEERYGETYCIYRNAVPRWLPKRPGREPGS